MTLHYFVMFKISSQSDTFKPLKVLHLTDIHITPDYEVNSTSTCGFPLCCKKGLASHLHEAIDNKRAGKWGDYHCDIPLWLFGNVIQHIQQFHKV